ncbi:MAG: InlB B-repeat-containing protein [Clostridia bacterium]|nr:InlB B-repeat-containing protein [Clostridia bacterium]
MKLLKKSFKIFVAAILAMAFALTVTACSKNDTKKWSVTFNSNKGSLVATQYIEDGAKAIRPENPARDGFIFVDWFDDTSYETVYDFDKPVTGNITLYAKWQSEDAPAPAGYHTVTFDSRGGSAVKPQIIKDGFTASLPAEPTWSNHTFKGWYSDSSCTNAYDFSSPVTGDVTVYAKWDSSSPSAEKIVITLNYNYDNKSDSVEIDKDSTLPLANQSPVRTDWHFAGWFKDSACTQMFNLSERLSANITLYAKWAKDPVQPADGTGIDFSKEWDGSGNGGTGGSDNFVFDKTVSIGSVNVDPTTPETPVTEGQLIVTFNTNGGTDVSAQSVTANHTASAPVVVEKEGYMFCGWYKESTFNTLYDFSEPVTTNITLHAKWAQVDSRIKSVKGYNESIGVVFSDSNPAGASVQYTLKGTSGWKSVDAPLIRNYGNGNTRVDIVGLAAGEYEVKIKTSSNAEITLPEAIKVTAYDRSGYAHFNYNEGVGAYNNDGTLKDNTLVIYLTESNKNDILNYCYVNGVKTDITQYATDSTGTVHKGIGELFNNRRYSGNDRANVGIAKLTHVYGAVSLRIIGQVDNDINGSGICSIIGLTNFNSTENGGTVGDSGGMARMVNAKNVTVEGVGEDAVVKGWGFHFVSSTISRVDENDGKSFEARNITFKNYPEDALGMEGEQDSKKITATIHAPVERCWVHHNTFYQGGNGSAAESDKGEGDGSCDFKRGQFYTFSYNYLEGCHKTNLIGSAQYSLQFNISMHHNMWVDCQSRMPLVRNANVHFYNNYVLVTGEAAKQSVIHSVRAQAYLYSEYNYYDGCKRVAEDGGEGGGVGIKGYNDIYYSCYQLDQTTKVDNRESKVSNSCKYIKDNIDYSSFDTNPSLFYYDAENKRSDCLLDDAIGARTRVMMNAGVKGSRINDTRMNFYEPTKAVQAGTTVDATKASDGSEVDGVLFKGFKTGKGKGQIATFKLTAPMEVTITGAAGKDESFCPQLLDSYGRVWIEKFSGNRTVVLPAGTYFIGSGQKDKESTIGTISFADTAASSEARVNAAKTALAAIPEEIGTGNYSVIKTAKDAYNALMASERTQIPDELLTRLQKAEAAYNELAVERVIARIDYIGTVDENSYNKIIAARNEYTALHAEMQALVTNVAKLVAAENAFAKYAAKNVTDKINDLPDLSKATISTLDTLERVEKWFNAVDLAYLELTDEQQKQVTNYNKVAEGYAKLEEFANLINFRAMLADVTVDSLTLGDGAALKRMYTSLTDGQKALLTFDENKKYEAIAAKYAELASQSKSITFNNSKAETEDGSYWTFAGSFKAGLSVSIDGTTFTSGLKLDSKGSLKFTMASEQTVKIYFTGKTRVKIDGVDVYGEQKDGYYVITVTLKAETHTITKGKDGESYLHKVEITP